MDYRAQSVYFRYSNSYYYNIDSPADKLHDMPVYIQGFIYTTNEYPRRKRKGAIIIAPFIIYSYFNALFHYRNTNTR